MAKPSQYPPQKRKEPGLIGKLFSALVQLVFWLFVSLIFSIAIEWIGMAYFWPEQGESHAKSILAGDHAYLNHQLRGRSVMVKDRVVIYTQQSVEWLGRQSWPKMIATTDSPIGVGGLAAVKAKLQSLLVAHQDYLQASMWVSQTFVIRLTLILFSLPIFAVATLVGAVDGLVERDLRRWGGGRESSNVFNLAKKLIMPAFVSACVVYISLPFSVNPVLVILPFALLQGLAVRVAFERLKKYF